MSSFALAASTIVTISLIAIVSWNIRMWFQLRAERYETSESLLRQHLAALDRFVSDPASPERAKGLVVMFSDLICQRHLVAELLNGLRDDKANGRDSSDNAILRSIDALRATRPDLAEDFYVIISAGLLSSFMRWPTVGNGYDRKVASIIVDNRREFTLATRLVKSAERRDPKDIGHVPGAVAAA